MMPTPLPLISIGIPTYNRVDMLKRALESARLQTYPNLQIVISDNASEDATESFCKEVAGRDRRILYLRQARNIGLIANFRSVLDCAAGEFFMWLSDDDWLDTRYVEACYNALSADPELVLACGASQYYKNGELAFPGEKVYPEQREPTQRVIHYLSRVGANGILFGLARRAFLQERRFREGLGGDWVTVADIVFQGPVKMLEEVHIHRSAEGESEDVARHARRLGVPRLLATQPHLIVALNVFRDIAWRSPTYAQLGTARLRLAAQGSWQIFGRYCLAAPRRRWRHSRRSLRAFLERHLLWRFRG